MKKIENLPLGELLPGMRVATAVTDDGGRVLLPAGAELSASSISGLARREVAAVAVEIELPDDPAEVAARVARIEAELEQRFRRAGDGAETVILRAAVRAHCLGNRP